MLERGGSPLKYIRPGTCLQLKGGGIFTPFLVTLRSKEKISDESQEKLDDFSVVFFHSKLAALVSFKRTREVGKEYCENLSASKHSLEHLTSATSLFDAVCCLTISWKREEDEELDCICKVGGTRQTLGQTGEVEAVRKATLPVTHLHPAPSARRRCDSSVSAEARPSQRHSKRVRES